MSSDTLDAQPNPKTSPLDAVLTRIVQQELARKRTGRSRSGQRRSTAERARYFDKVSLTFTPRT